MTVRCPNCFTVLFRPPQAERTATAAAEAPRRRWLGSTPAAATAPPPEPRAPDGTKHPTECPTCERTIERDWYASPTTCIAAAGARATGKSIYLAVMIKQLEFLATTIGLQVRPATPDIGKRFEDNYVHQLYRERGIMRATPTSATAEAYQREPFVFTLTTRFGQRHNLVIRDVAGEDLENLDDSVRSRLGFFSNADVILFLFDPLKIEVIRTKLRITVAEQLEGMDPLDILNNTLSLVRGPAAPRLGVIMSKFDVMQKLQVSEHLDEWTAIMRNLGAGINNDPGPLGNPADVRGDLVHQEVRSLLMSLGASPFVYQAQMRGGGGHPDGHRFFAVSALGDPPDGQALSSRGIAPFRALDPLRWALEGTGVLA